MLITPRTYRLSQIPDKGESSSNAFHHTFSSLSGWNVEPVEYRRTAEMLLIHQVGSVKVGDVIRFVSPIYLADRGH